MEHRRRRPTTIGLYEPEFEHDSCGIGFIAHIKGHRSHDILEWAHQILGNMSHRSAVGSDANSGDGAGLLTALPHRFLERVMHTELGIRLPERGLYAAGLLFLPPEADNNTQCRRRVSEIVAAQGQRLLGFRPVARDNSLLGAMALACEPDIQQICIAADGGLTQAAFERILYVIRKQATRELRGTSADPDSFFYVCSLSTTVIVYKGMLQPKQLFAYYPDLRAADYESHVALYHTRFSTNTFPSWDRAQPMRVMSHNGEINTLRGNRNKMRAREGLLASPLFGHAIEKLRPIIEADTSDSGAFDNVLELLLLSGRSLPEAIMMMVPQAWQNNHQMPADLRAAYEYMSCKMEPWDGPASISFSDGHVAGALLDRNGLRPSRYYVTTDNLVIMASEAGVLPIPPQRIRHKGRLQPGRMFLVDFDAGRIITDNELKHSIAALHPYTDWLQQQRITLPDGAADAHNDDADAVNLGGENLDDLAVEQNAYHARLGMFGYSTEHLELLLAPMATNGKEPLGSMGNDAPLAVLSERPRLLYDYFKQLFAQVTNPPIDSIREELVMSLKAYIGPEHNLLDDGAEHCRRLLLDHPVLLDDELARLQQLDRRGMRAMVVDATYPIESGPAGLVQCLDRIAGQVEQAVGEGYGVAIISDRAAGHQRVPVSALLALGAVHHHLIRRAQRTHIALVIESGEPREVHHFCALIGYGADAVNPWLALEAIERMRRDGRYEHPIGREEAQANYRRALAYGMRKVFGKMGISTLESYKAAQIFEIVGLNRTVVERCFAGTASRIDGVGFDILAEEALQRHHFGYPTRNRPIGAAIMNPGDYQWRYEGEKHLWDPQAIADLQTAVRGNDRALFRRFSEHQDQRVRQQATIRGLMRLRSGSPIPLAEVEPAAEIMKRFVTGAMSFGSISQEAHETLAVAMNRIGGKSNTGEGGEMPERYAPLANGDSKRSAIKQVASGRFGVTSEYLTNAVELQIKMAQGAKPGEGGELPGHKVFDVIAKTRYSTPGVGLISPPPHHDIYSIEDLAQLIFDLKNANPRARISVKLVSEVGVGTIAAGVAKAHADHILIAGHDGGTGASPLTGIKHAGLPWELGLAETHQTLVLNNLRSRVVVQTDGQLKTGRDVVIAALLGAEECGFATAALVAMGCIMMRVCHKNTCPVGIATQDERLRRKFAGRPEDVVNYFTFVAEDVRGIMAQLGFRTFNEMIGRTDMLESDPDVRHWKSSGIDLSRILAPAQVGLDNSGLFCCIPQEHGIAQVLDRTLIEHAEPAITAHKSIYVEMPIRNTDRTTGAMLSNRITRQCGPQGLSPGSLHVKFDGSAGQSFGAWLTSGVTFELEGDANDYVGKGLSGGTLIIYPPRESGFSPEENVIIGNVSFYGATMGHAYLRGIAAERFCVRNSGAHVVVEGIGDHGCEYMTGGRVLILGAVGANFAAGMSGGIAYVWDPLQRLAGNLNSGLVEIDRPTAEDEQTIRELARAHSEYTASALAAHIVATWDERRAEFVRVISPVYRNIIEVRNTRGRRVAVPKAISIGALDG